MYGKVLVLSLLAALTTGCPTVDLGDDLAEPGICRPSTLFFEQAVWPQFFAPAAAERSCVSATACHRQSDGRSSLRVDFDPAMPDVVNLNDSYNVIVRFLNCGSPESSSLLTKPLSGIDSHGGGDIFAEDSEQYLVFLAWFNQ